MVSLMVLVMSRLPFSRRASFLRALPGFDKASKAPRHVVDLRLVVHLSGMTRLYRRVQQGAPHREPLDELVATRHREGAIKLGLRRLEPQQHDAAAIGI